MKLNHLNLTVDGVDTSRGFSEKHFDMTCVVRHGKRFAAKFDDDQFV